MKLKYMKVLHIPLHCMYVYDNVLYMTMYFYEINVVFLYQVFL